MDGRFQRLSLLVGESNVHLFSSKTVLVLGVGGVGGYVVESLARSGIGTFILVDHDLIDLTNINRQLIALSSTIGQKKIDVFCKRIREINPDCKVIRCDQFIDFSNYIDLFHHQIDYFVDACDTIKTKKLVIEYCLLHDIPIISSMGVGNRFDPSKLEIVDIKKTSGDPLARIIRKYLREKKINKKLMVLCSRELPKRGLKEISSNAFVPSSAGLLIGSHIIKELMKK